MGTNMDETKLRTIAQLQEFLAATPELSFTGAVGGGDTQRYEHVSRVLHRFGHRQCSRTYGALYRLTEDQLAHKTLRVELGVSRLGANLGKAAFINSGTNALRHFFQPTSRIFSFSTLL